MMNPLAVNNLGAAGLRPGDAVEQVVKGKEEIHRRHPPLTDTRHVIVFRICQTFWKQPSQSETKKGQRLQAVYVTELP